MATPYIILQDGRARLTVIDGGRTHSFDLALTAVGRLAAEASAALWTVTQDLAARDSQKAAAGSVAPQGACTASDRHGFPMEDEPLRECAKVMPFSGITKLDLPPDRILEQAKGRLEGVVILGYRQDGSEYFASSYADGGAVNWLLDRLKGQLLNIQPKE